MFYSLASLCRALACCSLVVLRSLRSAAVFCVSRSGDMHSPENAWLNLRPDRLAFPWEARRWREPFSFAVPWNSGRPTYVAVPYTQPAEPGLARWARPGSVYQKVGRAQTTQEDMRRRTAISQWTLIAGTWPEFFVIVSQCRDSSGAVHPPTLETSIQYAVAPKATNTIVRRLGSFTDFVEYAVSRSFAPFPVTEDRVFAYFDMLHTTNAAAGKASSFLQCLNWMRAVLQAIIPEEVRTSSRVKGAAASMQQKAPPPQEGPSDVCGSGP